MELIDLVLIFVSIYDYFTLLKSFFFQENFEIRTVSNENYLKCRLRVVTSDYIIMTAYTHTNPFEDGDNTYLFRHVYMFDYFLGISVLKILFVRQNIHQNFSVYSVYCIYSVYGILLAGISN